MYTFKLFNIDSNNKLLFNYKESADLQIKFIQIPNNIYLRNKFIFYHLDNAYISVLSLDEWSNGL